MPDLFAYSSGPVSWDVDLDPESGDLFVFCVNTDGNGDITSTPTGLTRLDGSSGAATGIESALFYRVADGTETGTIYADGFALGKGNNKVATHVYRFRATDWGTNAPEATKTVTRNDGGGQNPPALTPSGWVGSDGTHWIAFYARDETDGLSSGPTGYDPATRTPGGGGGFQLATAYLLDAVDTEGATGWSWGGGGEGAHSFMVGIEETSGPPPGEESRGWGIPV